MFQQLIAWLTSPTAQHLGLVVVYVVLVAIVGRKSQIDTWCSAHPRIAGIIKVVRGACPIDPLLIVQGIALIVFRRLPVGYQGLIDRYAPPPDSVDPGVNSTVAHQPRIG